MDTLNLDNLSTSITGISETWIACYIEAAKVALIKNGHSNGVKITVVGDYETVFWIKWSEDLSQETIDSWKNNNDAAEYGAIAIAMLLIQKFTDFNFFEISNIGTGVDFWLGTKLPKIYAIQYRQARLEVSGILTETPSNTVTKRTWEKVNQVKQSDYTNLPAFIVVTAFNPFKSKFLKR